MPMCASDVFVCLALLGCYFFFFFNVFTVKAAGGRVTLVPSGM